MSKYKNNNYSNNKRKTMPAEREHLTECARLRFFIQQCLKIRISNKKKEEKKNESSRSHEIQEGTYTFFGVWFSNAIWMKQELTEAPKMTTEI